MPVDSIKRAPCIGCGAAVPYKTNARVCCEACAVARKRQRARDLMQRKRRAAGVAAVKGTRATCTRCSVEFVRNSIRHIRCADCSKIRYVERTRQASIERRTNDDRRERFNEWSRNKRRSDPQVRLSAHMRCLMHRALRGAKAGRSWRQFVDYGLDELRAHIERQFQPGMSWENRGDWHIDHIVPQASFQFASADDPEFRRCWALTNLRPLWAAENVRKNATRTHLL